jgi:hypothetical protein
MRIKITDLPDGPWRNYALEAQRRGLEKISDVSLNATDIILIGAIDMIRELTEKLDEIKKD